MRPYNFTPEGLAVPVVDGELRLCQALVAFAETARTVTVWLLKGSIPGRVQPDNSNQGDQAGVTP